MINHVLKEHLVRIVQRNVYVIIMLVAIQSLVLANVQKIGEAQNVPLTTAQITHGERTVSSLVTVIKKIPNSK